MTYLPIFFICLVGGECDFVHAPPVPTKEICEIMNAEYEMRLDAIDEVVAYKSACIPLSTPEVTTEVTTEVTPEVDGVRTKV